MFPLRDRGGALTQTHPTTTAAGLPIWWVRSTRQRKTIYHDSQADIFVVAAKIGRGRKLKDYVYIVSSDLRPTEIGEQVSRKATSQNRIRTRPPISLST